VGSEVEKECVEELGLARAICAHHQTFVLQGDLERREPLEVHNFQLLESFREHYRKNLVVKESKKRIRKKKREPWVK